MSKQSNDTILHRKYLKEYNRLAKKADRRMRELERFSRWEGFENIKEYAYKLAAKMIEKWTPPGSKNEKPRWQRNEPLDTRTLKAKIKDIELFLSMKSSTITGIKDIYKKRAETINERYGTNFTWQNLASFYEDGGIADKTFDKYGSKTVLVAYGKIQRKKRVALRLIEDFNEKHEKISGNVVIEEIVNEMLKGYGLQLETLLKG